MFGRYLYYVSIIMLLTSFACTSAPRLPDQAETPPGAKAIFDTGEGPAVRIAASTIDESPVPKTPPTKIKEPAAVATKTTKPAQKKVTTPTKKVAKPVKAEALEKYMGVAYKIILLHADGRFDVVSKSHAFKTGDRIKMLVRTNQSGYISVVNIGTTGRTHVLFKGYIEAFKLFEIPQTANLLFAGKPGTEKVLIMLSQTEQNMAAPPSRVLASMQGAKDVILEDDLGSSYAVVSAQNDWKPERSGAKDIILESVGGVNYGVLPAADIKRGGVFTLEIKLTHK